MAVFKKELTDNDDEYQAEIQELTLKVVGQLRALLITKFGKTKAADVIRCMIEDHEIVFNGLIPSKELKDNA